MLELPILGLLKEQPMHGYQLSKELTDVLGGFWRVSYGSLYPTLRRLEKQGAVETAHSEATVGRRKNVYRITDAGEVLFEELLQEGGQEASEDTKFRMRLAFFRYLKPETRIRLLERRRSYLLERLDTIQARLATTSPNADAYTLSIMTHGQDATVSDIAWLEGLIAAERHQLTTPPASGNGSRSRSTRRRSTTASTTPRTKKRRSTSRRKERTT